MLEFDGQALDPAIVSAQPMKPGQTVDLQQMGCPASELCSDSHYSRKIHTHIFECDKAILAPFFFLSEPLGVQTSSDECSVRTGNHAGE